MNVYTGALFYTIAYSAVSLILPKKIKKWLKDYIELRLPMMEK